MYREFVRTFEFEKCWASFGLTEEDIVDLEVFLCENPESGAMMEGTGGLRKIRWALPNRGKSSGIRVIYVDFMFYEKLYLITAYTKKEQDNLTQEERNEIKKFVKLLEVELKRK